MRLRLPLERLRLQIKRAALPRMPDWEGCFEGFAVNYCEKNEWRVQPEYDFEDLYQDACMIFLELPQRYPHVYEPRHLMSLYQTWLRNHITNLASRRTRRQKHETAIVRGFDIPAFENDDERQVNNSHPALPRPKEIEDDVEIQLMLAEAPEVVRMVMEAVKANGGPKAYRRVNGIRETTDQWLARVSGIYEPGLAEKVWAWLKGEPCSELENLSTSISLTT